MRPFKYLTNQYVEALGLPETTIWLSTGYVGCFIPENAIKPEVPSPFVRGLYYDGHCYACEDDGLAWVRV